jgi:hypothetical protein
MPRTAASSANYRVIAYETFGVRARQHDWADSIGHIASSRRARER